MKPIPYGRHHITDEDIQAITDVLKSNNLTQGPKIAEFEAAFADYIGCKYAVAVSSGTAALHLCTIALNVEPGQKVITTPITFSATANCVRYCGGEVVFADIDSDTFLLDINKVRELLEASPKGIYKGIIPVDFAGYPVNLEEFRKLADEFGLWIIEDACHSPGGYFVDSNGKKHNCGNGDFADLAIFSFHPVKHIATGEGGMVTTNNKELYERIRNLRTHGIQQNPEKKQFDHGIWYYEMQELGYNYRLTDIASALGVSQLKRATEGLNRRKTIAARYDEIFKNTTLIIPDIKINVSHAYHLYVIQHQARNGLIKYLIENKIIAQVHYIPIHLMPYYRQFGWKESDMPLAENYYKQCLSIPIYPTLENEEQEIVISTILSFLNNQE
jgi:UDP-4-amino-4,6-dideoxy-N-acetyl-beta-L-altrosamine transaminase